MEKPRIRWVEAIPTVQDGQHVIVLKDVENIVEHALVVSRETAIMISLMDGSRTLADIQADYHASVGEFVPVERIRDLVEALDDHLFLSSDRYQNHFSKLKQAYEGAPVRPSFLAGRSFAADRAELLVFLDEMLGTEESGDPAGDITGFLAPHIDYPRGRGVYRETYRFFRKAGKPLIVILGTCHHFTEGILSISCKDFETPLGVVSHCKEVADRIRSDRILKTYIDEWPHRAEHSIELQLPLLQYTCRDRFDILPILTGSMHEYIEGERHVDDGEIDGIVDSFKGLLEGCGRPYLILAGADLAHIGAQFGDTFTLDGKVLDRSRSCDQAILESVRGVDGKGFFDYIKNEGDARRICGLTPIYLQLKLLQGSRCDIISYDQWTDGKSSVSFAGGVFYRG